MMGALRALTHATPQVIRNFLPVLSIWTQRKFGNCQPAVQPMAVSAPLLPLRREPGILEATRNTPG
jgi:hypothetical protein